jgi:hypothetical protein
MGATCKDTDGHEIRAGDRVKLEEPFERSSGDIIPVGTVFKVGYLFIDGTIEVSWDNDNCVVPAKNVKKL